MFTPNIIFYIHTQHNMLHLQEMITFAALHKSTHARTRARTHHARTHTQHRWQLWYIICLTGLNQDVSSLDRDVPGGEVTAVPDLWFQWVVGRNGENTDEGIIGEGLCIRSHQVVLFQVELQNCVLHCCEHEPYILSICNEQRSLIW